MPPDGLAGGAGLDAYLKGIQGRLGRAREVRAGFLEGGLEPGGASMPMVAAIQEFGAPRAGIPPRPFFRSMIAKHKGEWSGQLGKALLAHDYDSTAALSSMGEIIDGELRESIIALISPPLSPVTLMLRQMRHENPGLVVNRGVVRLARNLLAAGKSYASVTS